MSKEQLSWAHPLVAEWFNQQFGKPTDPQIKGWASILKGQNTLISAPTGSGKTFAAFLICLNQLVIQALNHTLPDYTEVVYISPLKALSNDIHKNLLEPLAEIKKLAKKYHLNMADIRVAVRTGDTLPRERQSMLKKPPHILVTTPESLYILLTADKSRQMLTAVKTVIVDEIHAMLNDKRGTHLALTLERLQANTSHPLVRIGLSATQKPIEVTAQFLTGNRPLPHIVNIGHTRPLELSIEVPESELGAVAAYEMWDEIYDKIADIAKQKRSTLVFVNTRRLAERVAHHLAERLGEEVVAAHHGSLSRKLRLAAETKLKNGELKILVATASLELGIDIGAIDLVCQIGSPRAIAAALQRIGRAGHWVGGTSIGKIFVTTRDELLECAALVHAIQEKELDAVILPSEPIDILAQQIVAICATGDWAEDALYSLIKQAYPYRDLSKKTFAAVITMLSQGIAGSRGRYGAFLFHDQVNNIIKARRGSRLIAITSGGAIPDNGLFSVITEPNGTMVGTLDEDFAVESNRGDIILLGTTSWRIKRIESAAGKVIVEDAQGAPPSVPFWRGEAPARTKELSYFVANLRQKISDLLPDYLIKIVDSRADPAVKKAVSWLITHCGLTASGAEQLLEYCLAGRQILGALPTQKQIIAERFFDESGGMQLIIHAPFGARINKAWGLALRKKFCRSFNFELQAAATDDGINISLTEQHSFPLADVFKFLHPNTIQDVVIQAVLQAPLFATRWRWDAARALALLRFQFGKKVPPNLLRMRAEDLLAAVFPEAAACQDNLAGQDITLPDHPLIDETMKDVLHEALDIEGLKQVLNDIIEQKITTIAVDTPVPSVFSHEILNANPYAYLDDAPLEERRARAVEMRRVLPPALLQEIGKLDPQAIATIKEDAWPDIRNSDELHDMLQTFIALPETLANSSWHDFFDELIQEGRAGKANYQDKTFWLAAESMPAFAMIYPNATLPDLKQIAQPQLSKHDALLTMIRAYLQHLGPIKNDYLAALLNIDLKEIAACLLKLESTGSILRGHFTQLEHIEWCDRRLLARIHKQTLEKLRQSIEPVTAYQFIHWLLKWQHLSPGAQLQGEQGLLTIIRQLQGFEIPMKAWEKHIFPKRIKRYQTGLLDQLCLSGRVGWGRFSPHPASGDDKSNKKISATRSASITFFVRDDMYFKFNQHTHIAHALSHVSQLIYDYLSIHGASFFLDIVAGINRLKSEVETGLWELVAAGLLTADSFGNLRSLLNAKKYSDRRRRPYQPFSTSRWALLKPVEVNHDQWIEKMCWQLLKRYGVVFRDLLVREKNLPSWRELLIMFRRLEDRGEIRGGRFVSGFLGEQFALPYAVESLRNERKIEAKKMPIHISAADPLNLIGIILPGQKIPSHTNKTVIIE